MFFQKKRNIGLDIGNDAVKVAIVDACKGVISNLWRQETVEDRQSKEQLPKEEDLVKAIHELLAVCKKECAPFKKEVSASIFGGGSICRYIELPHLKPKELAVAVPSQAIKHIPFPMEKVTLSYIQVPRISEGGDKIAVFFITEQNESISFVKKVLKQCNVEASRIESPVLALPRKFSRDHRQPKDQFVALVYIGFVSTYVIIVRGRYPYFAREISIAGRDFTYAFQMGTQSSWQEADNYKIKYDVMQREIPIEPFLSRWLDEIKKSLNFFKKQFGDESLKVEKVILSGGTAGMINLDKRTGEFLGIPVEVDHLEHLKYTGSAIEKHEIYSVAVGLALE